MSEIARRLEEASCPVAKAVAAIHEPELPPDGMQWLSGGREPHCSGCSTGDPYLDSEWPCDTIKAVVNALDAIQNA